MSATQIFLREIKGNDQTVKCFKKVLARIFSEMLFTPFRQ